MEEARSSLYIICQKTKALMTKDATYYRTQIFEEGRKRQRHSRYNAEQLLDYNCLRFDSDIEGRKRAVERILRSNTKLPIPIDTIKGIYMLPTASVKNKNCVWLAYHHIRSYEQRDDKTFIDFYDDTGIYVNASVHTIDMQYKRTSQVIIHFNRVKLFETDSSP